MMIMIHYGKVFNDSERFEIEKNLKLVYNLLYSDGSNENIDFLVVDAIDYCTFGNSNPFWHKD